MKTAKEWFEEKLPEGIRERAINNIVQGCWDERFPTFKYALKSSFMWNRSAEGHDFWKIVLEIYDL